MKPRDARRRATLAQPRTKALECCETTTVLALTHALTLRLSLFGETKGVPKAVKRKAVRATAFFARQAKNGGAVIAYNTMN